MLAVNGWHNLVQIALGLVALALAGSAAARTYCARPRARSTSCSRSGDSSSAAATILGLIPVNAADNVLHLVLGLTGLAAGRADAEAARPRRAHAARSRDLTSGAGGGVIRVASKVTHRSLARGASAAAGRVPQPAGELAAAATAQADDDERPGRGAAGGDGDHRADPVARIAQRLELTLGEIVGPARKLGRRLLGDRRKASSRPGWRGPRAARSDAARR